MAGSKTVLAVGPGLAPALYLDDFSVGDFNLTLLLFEQVERIWWTLLQENFAYFEALVDMTGECRWSKQISFLRFIGVIFVDSSPFNLYLITLSLASKRCFSYSLDVLVQLHANKSPSMPI